MLLKVVQLEEGYVGHEEDVIWSCKKNYLNGLCESKNTYGKKLE